MALSKSRRAEVREMFGGNCAYCGHPLGERWHADHVEPVMRQTKYVRDDYGRGKFVQTGKLYRPENDGDDNRVPACAPCNIHKSVYGLEDWREILQRQVEIALRSCGSLRHAQRFGLVHFSDAPIVFYFEKLAPIEEGTK